MKKTIIQLSFLFLSLSGYAEEYVIEGDLSVVSNLVVGGNVEAGRNTTASGYYAHSEGLQTEASGKFSHSEGFRTSASGVASHSEGGFTRAGAVFSHAEGFRTEANGQYSHSEGYLSLASGVASHAAGEETVAAGTASYAGGVKANAEHDYTFVWSGSDDMSSEISSTTNRQFIIYAPNGIYLLGGAIAGDGSALTNLYCEPYGDLSMGSFTNRP
ncbi:hypothetical protein BVX94_02620 [bacterium B17]|nr:hypothetical protein BVX94_02620 [bacterium B17]